MNHVFTLLSVLIAQFAISQNVCFDPAADNRYNALGGASRIETGDFNEDGNLDVAVASYQEDILAVLMGNGDGTLQPAELVSVIGACEEISVDDYTGDGHLDIVVFCRSSQPLKLLPGNGDGTFGAINAAPITMPTSFPHNMTNADFNGDGSMDAAINNFSQSEVWIMFGTGPSFTQAQVIDTSEEPEFLTSGDFDGDGDTDVALSFDNSPTIQTYLNNGIGNFVAGTTIEALSVHPDMVLHSMDVNGDGMDDILAAGLGTISVFVSTGIDSYAAPTGYNGGAYFSGFASGNFYGGEGTDLVYASDEFGFTGLMINNESGGFNPYRRFSSSGSSTDVATGDFNEDGLLDAVMANSAEKNVAVLLNQGDGRLGPDFLVTNGAIRAMAAADFDEDGDIDIVTTSIAPNEFILMESAGDGLFMPSEFTSLPYGGISMVADDFNLDGNADLLICSGTHANLFTGAGNLQFTESFSLPLLNPGGGNRTVVAGHFNSDNYPDIAVIYINSNVVEIALNNQSGGFNTSVNYPVGEGPAGLAVADLEGDGRDEVIVSNDTSNDAWVYTPNASGVFTLLYELPTGASPRGVTVNDFNGDGLQDIATSDNNSVQITVFLQQSGTGFSNVTPSVILLSGNASPGKLYSSDVTGDGNVDLLFIFGIDNSVGMLAGNGDGTFAAVQLYRTETDPIEVVIADYNEDGVNDLAVANDISGSVSVILNSSVFLELSSDNNLCAGETVDIGVTELSGWTYQWSNGAITPTITVSEEAVYSCEVTNQSGSCTIITPAVEIFVLNDEVATFLQDFNPDACDNGAEYQLQGGAPQGGIYSGNGVENGIFSPGAAGPGVHVITYSYTDPGGCGTTSATDEIEVLSAPTVTLNVPFDVSETQFVCLNFGPYVLAGGQPVGGEYTGEGVDGALWITENLPGGIYPLTYTYTAENGCVASATQELDVQVCPSVNEHHDALNIFPTVTDGIVRFNTNSPQWIRISDTTGKIILTRNILPGEPLDLSSLASGIYMIQNQHETVRIILY
jgi:hypothetical protein